MSNEPGGTDRIKVAREHLERSIELLTKNDTFGAILQLQKARTILNSLPETGGKRPGERTHDWVMVDPYTAECRLCGKRRPLRIEDRTLESLAQE